MVFNSLQSIIVYIMSRMLCLYVDLCRKYISRNTLHGDDTSTPVSQVHVGQFLVPTASAAAERSPTQGLLVKNEAGNPRSLVPGMKGSLHRQKVAVKRCKWCR